MRLLELLFDQNIGVNTSTSTVAQWDFIQTETVKTLVAFFCWKLATPASTAISHDYAGALGQSWVRRRRTTYWSANNHCASLQLPPGDLPFTGLVSQSQYWAITFPTVSQLKVTKESVRILRVSWDTQTVLVCPFFITYLSTLDLHEIQFLILVYACILYDHSK